MEEYEEEMGEYIGLSCSIIKHAARSTFLFSGWQFWQHVIESIRIKMIVVAYHERPTIDPGRSRETWKVLAESVCQRE